MNSIEIPSLYNPLPSTPSLSTPPLSTPPITNSLPQNIEIIEIGTGKGATRVNIESNENDIIDRRRIILKIKEYKQLLAHKLNGIHLDNLDTLSIEALEDLLKDVEFTIGVSSSAATLKAMSEGVFNTVGGLLHAPGLGSALCMNHEYVDTIHEVGIKYSSYIYQDPLLRLGLIVTQTAAVLFQMNRNQEITRLASSPVSSTCTEKFNSL